MVKGNPQMTEIDTDDKNIKVIAIIQARMGSSRLPCKVLSDICGKPMLWHLINRLNYSGKISDVILAIPDTAPNDRLEDFARESGLKYFRGSEEDVLSRYYQAAEKFGGHDIVRVTADNPLLDPRLIDNVAEAHINSDADYTGTRGYPLGINVEILTFDTLKKACIEAKLDYEREHVTPYIHGHQEIFKLNILQASGKPRRPDIRLTVDTEQDMTLVREIYRQLYSEGSIFYIEGVIDLLDKQPELIAINAHIKQKKLGE